MHIVNRSNFIKKDKKLFAIDIDGTLTAFKELETTDYNKKILKETYDSHGKILLVTGMNLTKDLINFLSDISFDYISTSNGSVLYDNNFNQIYKIRLDKDTKELVKTHLVNGNIMVSTLNRTQYFYNNIEKFRSGELDKLTKQYNTTFEFKDKSILFNWIDNYERLNLFYKNTSQDLLFNSISQKSSFIKDEVYNIVNIFPKNVDKSTPIKFLRDQLNFRCKIYSFGDSNLDISMFEVSDLSFAPINSTEKAKNHASSVIGLPSESCVGKEIIKL